MSASIKFSVFTSEVFKLATDSDIALTFAWTVAMSAFAKSVVCATVANVSIAFCKLVLFVILLIDNVCPLTVIVKVLFANDVWAVVPLSANIESIMPVTLLELPLEEAKAL